MESKVGWHRHFFMMIVVFVALFIPFSDVHANIGDFEYEDNGLTRTDSDGVKEKGSNEDDGGLSGWLDKLKGIKDRVIDETRDFFEPAIEAVGDTIDFAKRKIGEGLDIAEKEWNDFKVWAGDVWENTPDWVKSSLAFVGVSLAVVGIAVVGIISAPVAAVAIVGAGLAGGLYYVLNGGSDEYSFMGALAWTLGGAIIGGVGQATGAVAAGMTALRGFATTQLATLRTGFMLNRFATGSGLRAGLQVAKGLGAAWLKVGGPAAGVTVASHLINLAITGEFNGSEMLFDAGVTFLTAPLGFGLTRGFWNAGRSVRIIAAPIAGSALVGGFSNVAMQSFKGDATAMDFLIGSAVGLTFVVPDALASKFVNNSSVEYTYEYVKKQLGDIFSNSMDGKVDSK